jgi:hypothetical protein
MKSRLAVSVLFTLIAATFAPDAVGAFGKLRSWTGNVLNRYSMEICNRVTSRVSAPPSPVTPSDAQRAAIMCLDGGRQPLTQHCAIGNQPRVVGTISPDGKTITFASLDATRILSSHEGCPQGAIFKLAGSDRSETFDFIRTATTQIYEVVALMRIK